MDKVSSSEIVLAWPTCKKNDFEKSYNIFEALSYEHSTLTGKPLLNFSTDTDSTRRQVFNQLLNQDLDASSPIGEIISDLPFVDLLCGKHQQYL